MKTSKPSSKAAKEKKQEIANYEATLSILKKMEKVVRLTIKELSDEGLSPKVKLEIRRKSGDLLEEVRKDMKAVGESLKIKEGKKAKPKKQQAIVKKNKRPGKDI